MTVTVLRKLEVPALPVQPTATRSPRFCLDASGQAASPHTPATANTFHGVGIPLRT